MNKLVLFDIDGTLVAKHQGHYEAFAVGFREVYSIDASLYMTDYHGKTDQRIIREVLDHCGIESEAIDAKIGECMEVMGRYYQSVEPYLTTEIFDDVVDTLTALQSDSVLLGLITGNLEPIAHAKLGRANIDSYFKLGGFGNESVDRSELVRIAIRKASEQFGFAPDNTVYVIGDTPNDITAAIEGGAIPIGVTTGIYGTEDLRNVGATYVVDKLGDILQSLSHKNEIEHK